MDPEIMEVTIDIIRAASKASRLRMTEDEADKNHYYDVDRYKEWIASSKTPPPPSTFKAKAKAKILSALDSTSGLLSTSAAMTIVIVGPVIVVIGALYGPVSFIASFGGLIAVLGLYAERKLGKSIQVVEHGITLRALAQALAFLLFLAVLLFFAFGISALRSYLP